MNAETLFLLQSHFIVINVISSCTVKPFIFVYPLLVMGCVYVMEHIKIRLLSPFSFSHKSEVIYLYNFIIINLFQLFK